MENFLAKYQQHIKGTPSWFDRVIFKGYLPLGWPEARESLLARRGGRIMDFKSLVTQQSARFKAWADQVREPAKRPKLAAARRKCLCFDFFDLDWEFGLMHIRSQSWFPLTIPISVNGHD